MAEEILVKESLSGEMISAGAELARYLSNTSLNLNALLWLYWPELNIWRFVVASPEVKTSGPKKVYQEIRSAISNAPNVKQKIPLENIFVVDSDDPLIVLLRSAISTGQGIGGIRFTGNTINGVLIEDAYIYKLT